MNKKIIFAAVAVLLAIIALVIQASIGAKQDVTIHLANPVVLELYAGTEQDDTLMQTGDVIRTITDGEKFSIKKGDYVLVPTGTEFVKTAISLPVGEKPVDKTVDVNYNQEYLTDLLSREQSAINAAMVADYPKIATTYNINLGTLFGRGEWYGTTISNKVGPAENINGDTLRIVLHKEADGWTVASRPPAIILDKNTYTNIPVYILRAVNKLPTESIGQ